MKLKSKSGVVHDKLTRSFKLHCAGELERAERGYRQVLRMQSTNVQALHYLGLLQNQKGNQGEAEKLISRAIKITPDNPVFHNNLGEVFRVQGRFQEAISAYQEAVKLDESNSDAFNNFGLCLIALEDHDGAIDALKRAVEIDPAMAESWINLGNAYKGACRFEEARGGYATVGEESPLYLAAQRNRAATYLLERRPSMAEQCLLELVKMNIADVSIVEMLLSLYGEREAYTEIRLLVKLALKQNLSSAQIYVSYATALRIDGEFAEAERNVRLAIKADGEYESAIILLGACLSDQGCCRDASLVFNNALALNSSNATLYFHMGDNHLSLGNKEQAIACFRKAVEIDPEYASALERVSKLAPLAISDESRIEKLIVVAESEERKISERVSLHFALAEVFAAKENHDRAFSHYQRGNSIRKEVVPYSWRAHEDDVAAVIGAFSCSFVRKGLTGAVKSTRPVFIVGMPRSGTTLVEQILSSHPDFYGAGELPYFVDVRTRDNKTGKVVPYWQNIKSFEKTHTERLAGDYLLLLSERSNGESKVSDKMPSNYLNLGLIHMLFPEARIVFCQRDVRDCCLSIFCHNFGHQAFSHDLFEIGHRYQQHLRLMKHWLEVIPNRIFQLSYDELVTSPETMSRQLVNFCGLPWNDACLSPHQNERHVLTPSQTQVREPVYQHSRGRWRLYEAHLSELERGLFYKDTVKQ